MKIERFGTYTFPCYDVTDRLGNGVSSGDLVRTAGGAYDPFGDDAVNSRDYQIIKRMSLLQDSATDLQTALDAIRAIRGTKATLYCRTYAGYTRRAKARCIRVNYNRTGRNVLFQPVDAVFELLTTHWNGDRHGIDPWVLDSGVYLDDGYVLDDGNEETMSGGSPHTITVNNGGNKASTYNQIRITAGASNITSVKIENDTNDMTDMTWTGTLTAGQVLLIDCGTFSITNNGADAYSGLTINSGHKMGEWLRLDPGDNDVKITFSGGGTTSKVGILFWDGWA